jgi:aldehyde dehydrogenase (NAD+)
MIAPGFAQELETTFKRLQTSVRTKRRDYDYRMSQLQALKRLIDENEQEIFAALWKDLRKSPFECETTEQGVILLELSDALKNLKSWMSPERVRTSLYNFPSRAEIYREPLGVTLILGAWNYPLQLTLAPLVGAIAGGNGCIIKPPDFAPATATLIHTLVPKYLDSDMYAVIEGGKDEATEILKLPFDLIFFTGSTGVAKIVMTAAAQNLTPVVLELGGKSPAVVSKDCDLKVAAKRLTWGKFMNAGQTCVAPDYILVERSLKDELVREMKSTIEEFYGQQVINSPDYCRIIDTRSFDRLTGMLENAHVLHGGQSNRDQLFIEPTIIDADATSKAMEAEIFGPILPILTIDSMDEAISFINARPKPLALYLFASDGSVKERFVHETTSGSLVFNDLIIHMPEPHLPFGGVGNSGMGAYHGKFSFDTFTHAKGVLKKTSFLDLPARYAPYTDFKLKIMRWLFS